MHRTLRLLVVFAGLAGLVGAGGVDWKPVVDPYLKLHAALASDTIEGVSQDASALAAAAANLGAPGAAVAAAAKQVGAASDLKAARLAFMELSETLIKASTGALAPDIRIAFCPMVKKHWLQTGGEIRNPYYGSEMLTCGTFKK